MMRDPNSSIGIDDYVGTVGHEKHYGGHQTHFSVDRDLSALPARQGAARWVKVGHGRWKLVKDKNHAKESENL